MMKSRDLGILLFHQDLSDWLKSIQTVFTYENVDLPNEEARQVVESVVKTVYLLISKGKSHHYLHKPENYLLLGRGFSHGNNFKYLDQMRYPFTIETTNVFETCDSNSKVENMKYALQRLIFKEIFNDKVDHMSGVTFELVSITLYPSNATLFYGTSQNATDFYQYVNWMQIVIDSGGPFLSILLYDSNASSATSVTGASGAGAATSVAGASGAGAATSVSRASGAR